MAATIIQPNDPLVVQQWAKRLFVEAIHACKMDRFTGTTPDDAIIFKDETKGGGQKVTIGLRLKLKGTGVSGDGTLQGSEENLTLLNDSMMIDQLRNAVLVGGDMSQQRVNFDLRSEANSGLVDWWSQRWDTWFCNVMAGNENITDVRYTGMQAATPPSSMAFGYYDATPVTTEAAVSALTTIKPDGVEEGGMRLSLIDKLVVTAETRPRPIRRIKMKGREVYGLMLHPYQVLQLRRNTGSGQWLDIQKAAMAGGQITENPIYIGSIGEYNGVVIHQDVRVPWGSSTTNPNPDQKTYLASNAANVARGFFFGAQAAAVSFGRAYGNGLQRVKWVEELFDYENSLGVASSMVAGCKKLVWSGADFGIITVSTCSPAPTL